MTKEWAVSFRWMACRIRSDGEVLYAKGYCVTGLHTEEANSEALFLKFADSVLSWLRTWMSSNDVPQHAELFIGFTDKSYIPRVVLSIPYWYIVKLHFYDTLWSLPEANRCAQSHADDGILKIPTVYDADSCPIPEPSWEQV